MTTTLTREDTGEIAVVRVIDPGVHVSAPYSRAVGLLEKWAADERRAVDGFAAWIEGQAAQAHAEMRALCDELGLPVTARMTDTPRAAPPWWPTADHLAEHRGVDLLIKHRWDIDAMRAPDLVAQLNAGLLRIWPPDVQPGSVQWAELPPDPTAALAPEQLDREYALNNMVRQARRGWTPQGTFPLATGYWQERHGKPVEVKRERRDWSAEWAAFRDDVKDMWRDLRRSLAWWRKEEED